MRLYDDKKTAMAVSEFKRKGDILKVGESFLFPSQKSEPLIPTADEYCWTFYLHSSNLTMEKIHC